MQVRAFTREDNRTRKPQPRACAAGLTHDPSVLGTGNVVGASLELPPPLEHAGTDRFAGAARNEAASWTANELLEHGGPSLREVILLQNFALFGKRPLGPPDGGPSRFSKHQARWQLRSRIRVT